jgi:plastocyanin
MASTRRWLALPFAALVFAAAAQAAEPEVTLVIKNHRFDPAEVKVPAGQRIKLVVHNQDSTPEEFESHTLNREKVIPGGQKATIFIGPLKPGRYGFFGEYNEKTAQGTVVAE